MEDFIVTDVGDVAGLFEAVGVLFSGVLGVDGGDLMCGGAEFLVAVPGLASGVFAMRSLKESRVT